MRSNEERERERKGDTDNKQLLRECGDARGRKRDEFRVRAFLLRGCACARAQPPPQSKLERERERHSMSSASTGALQARIAEQEREIRELATHVQLLENHMDTLVKACVAMFCVLFLFVVVN